MIARFAKTIFMRVFHNLHFLSMMTSSNGNMFRVTGPLWGEFTGHQWIPLTKASDAELWCFLWSAPTQTVEWTIDTLVIWDAITPIMMSLWCHIWQMEFAQLASNVWQFGRWNHTLHPHWNITAINKACYPLVVINGTVKLSPYHLVKSLPTYLKTECQQIYWKPIFQAICDDQNDGVPA